MIKKLTPKMHAALETMAAFEDGLGSAYSLRVTIRTMDALCHRGLIKPYSTYGWSYSPQTCDWKITAKGRAAIAKATGGAA